MSTETISDDTTITFDPSKASLPDSGKPSYPLGALDQKLIKAIIDWWRSKGAQTFTARSLHSEMLQQGAKFPGAAHKQIRVQLSKLLKQLGYQHAPGAGGHVFYTAPPTRPSQKAANNNNNNNN